LTSIALAACQPAEVHTGTVLLVALCSSFTPAPYEEKPTPGSVEFTSLHFKSIQFNSKMDVECTVTIVAAQTGLSETIPVSLGTSVKELAEWSTALLGLQGNVVIYKDGNPLDPDMKLEQAGVQNGDLLAAQVTNESRPPPAQPAAGLDFSSILQSATAAAMAPTAAAAAVPSAGGGLDFSKLLMSQQHSMAKTEPVYYPGMTLNDALDYNTNPEHLVTLLQTREHLFKELNYHQPLLANKLRNQPYEKAVQIWREEILKGGIQSAVSRSTTMRKEQDYRQRLETNANDKEVSYACLWSLVCYCNIRPSIQLKSSIIFAYLLTTRPKNTSMHKSAKSVCENNISK
jgi:hypothetical protein